MQIAKLLKFGLALLAGAFSAQAQETDVMKWEAGVPHAGISIASQSATFNFIASAPGPEISQIKNAPFSATGVTEFRQTLGDGTVIQRNSTSKFARDSEGRTRTEQSLLAIGNMAPPSDMPQLISIFDPTANQSIMLDEKKQLAVITKLPKAEIFSYGGATVAYRKMISAAPAAVTNPAEVIDRNVEVRVLTTGEPFHGSKQEAKEEDLGTQPMEGVLARGTRTTTTIPAGAIGNSRAISVIRESWYSPDLETIVMSKTSDPQSGETTYRLTNIRRVEPDPTLFTAPAGYALKEVSGGDSFHIERKVIGR